MRTFLWLILIAPALLGGQSAKPTDATAVKARKEFNVMIPMRDGVKLAADIQRPDQAGKFPVILTRTPYGKYSKDAYEQGEYFAQHGYVYVSEDVRGRFDSEGTFDVLVNEARDGYDTIEWLASQPWSDGNVGSFGGSYSSWTQWLAAEDQPPHLRAMVVQSTPPDIFLTEWWHGALGINQLFWCALVDRRVNQELSVYTDPSVIFHLPVATMDEALGRHMEKTWRAWVQHNTFDDFWEKQSYQDRLSRVQVPVLHVDGWYDLRDVSATLQNFNTLRRSAASPVARNNQRAVIGAWWHGHYDERKFGDVDFGPDSVIDRKALYLRWYDCHLEKKNCAELETQAPVRYFSMGKNSWRDAQEWPPRQETTKAYFLHSRGHANSGSGDGVLNLEPAKSEAEDHYTYNPQDAPAVAMEPNDTLAGDQRVPESRNDVLVFTSDALQAPLEIAGHVEVKLWTATSAPDTDWVARLVDVHPDGFAQRLTDTIVRASYRGQSEYPRSQSDYMPLAPGEIREYTLDLGDLANVFLEGHRIRLEITSAFLPLFSRNLNTGKNNLTTSEMQTARQTIYHDAAHPSQISLPVITQ